MYTKFMNCDKAQNEMVLVYESTFKKMDIEIDPRTFGHSNIY